MQVVRHGDIDDVDRGIGEQFLVVGREQLAGGDALKPVRARASDEVRDGDELRLHGDVRERAPAGKGARHFAAHEAAADDADADVFHAERPV